MANSAKNYQGGDYFLFKARPIGLFVKREKAWKKLNRSAGKTITIIYVF